MPRIKAAVNLLWVLLSLLGALAHVVGVVNPRKAEGSVVGGLKKSATG